MFLREHLPKQEKKSNNSLKMCFEVWYLVLVKFCRFFGVLFLFFLYTKDHTSLIYNIFKQIPGLVTLKRLSCVSFAGVDSLDDVKNHTYNELFVSGGFVVSDESVLNSESITTGKCDAF